jgi:hypothetical protein
MKITSIHGRMRMNSTRPTAVPAEAEPALQHLLAERQRELEAGRAGTPHRSLAPLCCGVPPPIGIPHRHSLSPIGVVNNYDTAVHGVKTAG